VKLQPPIQPMLSKAADAIPSGEGWLYEPKWDGFRCLIFRDGRKTSIVSRDQRPLNRYVPDVESALVKGLPPGVYDGEILVAADGIADFGRLQMRLHPASSRVAKLAEESPACFVAFDILEAKSKVLIDSPFSERRARLEDAIALPASPCELPDVPTVMISGQTPDAAIATDWFDSFEDCGIDGLIAKRADDPYQPGKRVMLKIKRKRSADCVVGGYRVHKNGGVGSLLLGLYDAEGTFHFVGHCSNFSAKERVRLIDELAPDVDESSGFDGNEPGGESRWTAGRDRSWVSLKLRRVCEVTYDKMQGDRFRHASSFVRWRTDRKPKSCTFEQLK
jgi:ATP-dependent DNA ligase